MRACVRANLYGFQSWCLGSNPGEVDFLGVRGQFFSLHLFVSSEQGVQFYRRVLSVLYY